ncbi:hypothetical protein EJ02DRAFT_326787, partial [Clathrospora elynae]
MDAQVILKCFNKVQSDSLNTLSLELKGNGTSWNELYCVYKNAVKDTSCAAAKELSGALYSLQVNNKLYIHEIQGLR